MLADEKVLRWGIVGTGWVAETFIAPAIKSLPNAELTAIVGRTEVGTNEFSRTHNCRAEHTFSSLLSADDVDAIYIATPNALHAEMSIAAARAGKHVLCDKPLGINVDEAQEIIAACTQAGVALGVTFQTRFSEGAVKARQLLRDGAIGDPLLLEIEISGGRATLSGWRSDPLLAGAGAVVNFGVHAYDLVRYLLDDEVEELVAMNRSEGDQELETTSLVILRMRSRTLVYVNVNQAIPFFRPDFTVHGTQGRLTGVSCSRVGFDGELVLCNEAGEIKIPVSGKGAFDRLISSFCSSVFAGCDPDPSGHDGLRSSQIVDAIKGSARDRCVMAISEYGAVR